MCTLLHFKINQISRSFWFKFLDWLPLCNKEQYFLKINLSLIWIVTLVCRRKTKFVKWKYTFTSVFIRLESQWSNINSTIFLLKNSKKNYLCRSFFLLRHIKVEFTKFKRSSSKRAKKIKVVLKGAERDEIELKWNKFVKITFVLLDAAFVGLIRHQSLYIKLLLRLRPNWIMTGTRHRLKRYFLKYNNGNKYIIWPKLF